MTTSDTNSPSSNRRGFSVVGLLLLLVTATFTAMAPNAFAHDALVSSNPAADSVVASAPTAIELVFDQDVKDFQPKIAITISGHDPVEIVPTVSGRTVSADLAGVDLPGAGSPEPASWRIGYRIVSSDGHPVSGLLDFSVGSAPAGVADPTENSPVVGDAGDSSGQAGGIQWWWIAVGVLAIGVAFVVWLSRRRVAG